MCSSYTEGRGAHFSSCYLHVWSLLMRGRCISRLYVNRSEDWWEEEEEHRLGLYRKADSLTFIGTLD